MKDFIEKLINTIEERYHKVNPYVENNIKKIINQLVEEYDDGWIPVESGLLPNKTKEYLVTMINSDEKNTMYSVCHEIYYASTREWDCDRDEGNEWKVIAWKQKERPYKLKENSI